MKKILAIVLVSFLCLSMLSMFSMKVNATSASALALREAPPLQWNKSFGGPNEDQAYSVVSTIDGGYALAGHTVSFGVGGYDFWLVKTDGLGNVQWNMTYGGTGKDDAWYVTQTTDGGYALVGYTDSFGAGGTDAWLVKTDALGNEEWNKTYGAAGKDYGYSVLQTDDGGYVISGTIQSIETGYWDGWLIKTDSNGNMQWNVTYGTTSGEDELVGLIKTADNGYALAGSTYSYGAGMSDAWLVKTNSNGNPQWNMTYGGLGVDSGLRVVQTSDGGYTLSGTTQTRGAGQADFWLVKTDSHGNELWDKTYGGTSNDYENYMIQVADGGYLLAGHTESFGVGGWDYWVVKTDPFGNMQWNETYGGASDDWAYSLAQTSDGGYAVAGSTRSIGAGNFDFWLVKLAHEPTKWGVIIGVNEYSNPKDNRRGLVNSAMDVYDVLVNHMGFQANHVHLLVDRVGISDDDITNAVVKRELGWLQTVAIPEDLVVFYYAGHGWQSPTFGNEYVQTHESLIRDDEFTAEMNKISSKSLCVILDVSYSGGFIKDGQTFGQGLQGVGGELSDLAAQTPSGRIVLTACAENVTIFGVPLRDAREWPLWPTGVRYEAVFTHYLVQGFKGSADANNDGKVTVEEAFRYSSLRSLWSQTPMMYDGYPGYASDGELSLGN